MSSPNRVIAAGILILLCAVAFFLWLPDAPPLEPLPQLVTPAYQSKATFLENETTPRSPERLATPSVQSPASPEPAPRRVQTFRHPTALVAELEQRIRATPATQDRIDLVAELAHTDSAAAVLAMERLFNIERHPAVQAAMVANLADLDPSLQPDARMRLLRSALGPQQRKVRTTALEILAESEDPAARELLRKCSVSDPDHEVREVAAALLEAGRQ
jgi:hypothetical protein